tara:strand:+ start:2119 stop:2313 length:195 start_codon:yes stop_codon:yes gene_type:complete
MAKTKKKSKKNRSKLLAQLKEISPGVMVNKNYKKGKDSVLDKVLEDLKKDPTKIRSGMGDHQYI